MAWNHGHLAVRGLALFLFGMEQMSESLKAVAGEDENHPCQADFQPLHGAATGRL